MKKRFLLYSLFICILLFTVPFLFPQKEVVQSLSYEMGFNNAIGILLLVIASLILFVWGALKEKYANNLIVLDKEVGSKKLLHILQIISFSILMLFSILYWGVEDGILQAYWPVHYSDAMKHGWVLYEDVHVIYGALQILPLHWLRLLGIPAMTAQLLIVAVSSVLCLLFVYDILGYINIPIREKNAILILSSVLFFPYYMGIEGFRYVYTSWLLIKIILLSRNNYNLLLQLVVSCCSVVFAILFSQEYGLCLCVALVIYYFLDLIIQKHLKDIILIFTIALSLGILIWIYPGMFNAVLYMAGGASSFPYVPSLHLIILFIAVLMFAWMMGTQIRDIKNNYSVLVLELLLLSYLPSVLGRCNPSHVLPIAFFIIVISGIKFVQFYNKKVVMVIYCLTFLTPFPFIIKTQSKTAIRPMISNVVKQNEWIVNIVIDKQLPGYQMIVNKKNKSAIRKEKQQEFLSLLGERPTIMSFCTEEVLYNYLNENCNYKENFFGQSLSWLANEEQFKSVIDRIEFEKPDYIVLPKDYKNVWMNYTEWNVFNLWFCTYSFSKPYRGYNETLYKPLIDYIESNYCHFSTFENVSLYKNNSL